MISKAPYKGFSLVNLLQSSVLFFSQLVYMIILILLVTGIFTEITIKFPRMVWEFQNNLKDSNKFTEMKLNIVVVVCQIVCGLIRREETVQTPKSDISNVTKYEKIFIRRLTFSRFLAKTLRVIKTAMESFSKKLSDSDFKLQVLPLIYKISTHNVSGVRNQVNNPD